MKYIEAVIERPGGLAAELGREVHIAGGTQDYEKLRNRPSINGVELIGDRSAAELGIGLTYTHAQTVAASVWTITHNLDKYPSVTVVDSAGTVVVGDVQYTGSDSLTITFTGAFFGTAYLN